MTQALKWIATALIFAALALVLIKWAITEWGWREERRRSG